MALDLEILKKTAIYSTIFGAGLGIIALVPALMPTISLFLLPFLSGIIILIALEKLNPGILKTLDTKDCTLLGGMAGSICCVSFLIIFAPLVLFLKLFIKTYYTYGIDFLNFFLASVLIISVMLIFFATNAVGGLLTGFLINRFNKN